MIIFYERVFSIPYPNCFFENADIFQYYSRQVSLEIRRCFGINSCIENHIRYPFLHSFRHSVSNVYQKNTHFMWLREESKHRSMFCWMRLMYDVHVFMCVYVLIFSYWSSLYTRLYCCCPWYILLHLLAWSRWFHDCIRSRYCEYRNHKEYSMICFNYARLSLSNSYSKSSYSQLEAR